MKRYLFLLLLIAKSFTAQCSPDTDTLLIRLKEAIEASPVYDAKKIAGINQLKATLKTISNDEPLKQFNINSKLYEEYKTFNYDSAFLYAKKLQESSYELQDNFLITDSKIKLSFILVSAGLFKNAFDSLNSISLKGIPDSIKATYYSLMGRYYYDLADYNNDKFYTPDYYQSGNLYMDSALIYYLPSSFEFAYYKGLRDLKTGQSKNAISDFLNILQRPNLSHHQKALVESTLSGIYEATGQMDRQSELLNKAAIDDIKSSTKETTATLYLSGIYFKNGNLKAAFLCVEKAIQDAIYYGARQRQVQVSAILPIIQVAQVNAVEAQKKMLILYSSIVTLLLIALIVLFIIIYKQKNKLKAAKQTITNANIKEQEINHKLSEVNYKLSEANKIKEEYIIHFFNINTDFFAKIERFKNITEKKLRDHKYDDIKYLLNNINLKTEKEEMLKNFDKVFLRLFPNFVNEFNLLFKNEDRIEIKDDGLGNTDLRIFALMRMGITNNEKIAQILEYSVNTIYAYKTKIKKKSLVSSVEFDEIISHAKLPD